MAKFAVGDQVTYAGFTVEFTVISVLGSDTYIVEANQPPPTWTLHAHESALTLVQPANLTIPSGYAVFTNYYDRDTHTAISWVSEDQKKKWKEEGKCQECGKLLPISIHGLLDCPDHPKPLPEGHKQ